MHHLVKSRHLFELCTSFMLSAAEGSLLKMGQCETKYVCKKLGNLLAILFVQDKTKKPVAKT